MYAVYAQYVTSSALAVRILLARKFPAKNLHFHRTTVAEYRYDHFLLTFTTPTQRLTIYDLFYWADDMDAWAIVIGGGARERRKAYNEKLSIPTKHSANSSWIEPNTIHCNSMDIVIFAGDFIFHSAYRKNLYIEENIKLLRWWFDLFQ